MRLQAKLLFAIVPVIVTCLLMLGWLVYAQLRQHSEAELMRQMEILLFQVEQQIDSFVGTAQANAVLFANSNFIERYVMVEDEADRYDLMQPALLKLFNSYRQAYPEYREIRLLTPGGYEDTRLAADGLPNKSEEESGTEFFTALQNSRAPFYSAIGRNPDDYRTTLTVGRPIRVVDRSVAPIAAEQQLRGYLAVTASLKFIADHISALRIGQEGYLMVLDPQGTILFHRNPQLVGTSLYSLLYSLTDDQFDSASVNQASRINIQGKLSTVRWERLHDDLLLLAVIPESEFEAGSRQMARTVGGVTLLAIVLTTVLFFMLLRSTVLQPIMRLRQIAIAIGNGHLDTPVDFPRDDEIGELAHALADMNRKLGNSMSELQLSHARIEQLAYRDSLTDLPNRRLFIQLVAQAMAIKQRTDGRLAILFLDLDDFKRVNDTLGHKAGDLLLQEVASRLKHCIRESDELALTDYDAIKPCNQVARIGGDEFIILLSALGHPEHATIVARRIIAELARPVVIEKRSFVVGTSIGISLYPNDANDVDGLIKCADTAMYAAKRCEKNTYRYFGGSMQATIETRLQLEEDLRKAMQEQQFELYFQPQFDTHSGVLAGAEVLLRWLHPERGMIPPDLFIPVAEETGMIGKLGEWVLIQACEQWRYWCDQGIAPLRIAVNVSQRQFALGNLMATIKQALDHSDMQAEYLELELTESCMMEAPSGVVNTLCELRTMGVRIAMDDFGTGYSSLGALTSLPIDTLKIDRSFVSGIETDSQNSKVVSAILMLARSLDLEIVAEGVEVQAELDYLSARDCDVVQGYLLGKPLPAASMTELLLTLQAGALQQAS